MSNIYLGLGILLMTGGVMCAGTAGHVLARGDERLCGRLTLIAMALIFTGAWLWKLS